MISIKFLLVISMLCKTEWSWELQTWSHKMVLLNITLPTSPHYFCRKWIGVTKSMRIQISMLGFKVLKSAKYESQYHLNKWWKCYMILAWQRIKILVKKKLKSIYFKFIWFWDFYALVTEGLKRLTVSITLVGRIKLLWKQIDAPVVLVVNFIPKYILY